MFIEIQLYLKVLNYERLPKSGAKYDLLTGLLGPHLEIRSPIFFIRPELARVVRKSEGFVFLVRTE